MNISTLRSFCLQGRTFVLGEDKNGSLVQTICHRSVESAVLKLQSPSPTTILPGWGASWPGVNNAHSWPEYSTGVLTSDGSICFWPVIPNLNETENDVSLWMRDNKEKFWEDAVHYKKVMLSGGFFGNFWHAMAVFNVWCTMKNDDDLYFVVQYDGQEPPFLYSWAAALGISRDRIVIHNGPIVADELVAAHYRDVDADWSCVHAMHLPGDDKSSTEQHALVYFRNHSGVSRDIPEQIHFDFVRLLEERIPGLVVKTFYGSESFEETRELFSGAKIVIGPHGAGLANLVFCAEMIPVVEFITPEMFRVWQMFGGQTFNLHWWPVMLDSFDSRNQIMEAVEVVEEALIQSQASALFV